jgi:hypothetical protein
MKATLIRASGALELIELPKDGDSWLKPLQEAVGGYIEIVHLADWDGNGYDLVCHEEALLLNEPVFNELATLVAQNSHPGIRIFGDAVLVNGQVP